MCVCVCVCVCVCAVCVRVCVCTCVCVGVGVCVGVCQFPPVCFPHHNAHTFHPSYLPQFLQTLILQALALTKMRHPSDRQEFMSALAEWTQHVYGDNPNDAKENLRPVATTATLHLQHLMKDKVVKNLVGKSSGAMQDSSPPDSEITDDTVCC